MIYVLRYSNHVVLFTYSNCSPAVAFSSSLLLLLLLLQDAIQKNNSTGSNRSGRRNGFRTAFRYLGGGSFRPC